MAVKALEGQRFIGFELLEGFQRLRFDGGSTLDLFALPDLFDDGAWKGCNAPFYFDSLLILPGSKVRTAAINDDNLMTLRFGSGKALRLSLKKQNHDNLHVVASLCVTGNQDKEEILG